MLCADSARFCTALFTQNLFLQQQRNEAMLVLLNQGVRPRGRGHSCKLSASSPAALELTPQLKHDMQHELTVECQQQACTLAINKDNEDVRLS